MDSKLFSVLGIQQWFQCPAALWWVAQLRPEGSHGAQVHIPLGGISGTCSSTAGRRHAYVVRPQPCWWVVAGDRLPARD